MKRLCLNTVATGLLCAAGPASAELIDFEQPTYPDATPCCPEIAGVDGWTVGPGTGLDTWILFTDNSSFGNGQVMWNNGPNGGAAQFAHRDFAVPLRAGTLTYQVRPNNTGSGEAHWFLPGDGSTWALQLLAHQQTKTNTNHEFELRLAGGGPAGTSPDVSAIEFSSGEAWYEVRIDFDLDDTSAGANGTFDLQVSRIDGTPLVVWDLDGQAIANPVSTIGRWQDNGSVAVSGHATLIDNISFTAPVIPTPVLAFTEVASGAHIAFPFQSVLGGLYRLQVSTNAGSAWTDADHTIFGDGGMMHAFDNTPEGIATGKTYRVVAAPPLPALAGDIMFDPPVYPVLGAEETAELIGVDGWSSATNGEWSVVGGRGRDGSNALIPDTAGNSATTQPVTRNLHPVTAGTFSFEVWPANGGAGTTVWLILRDSTPPSAGNDTLLQLLYTADIVTNANDETFLVRDGGGGTLATVNDGAGSNIVSETWYLVTVDFDLADFTAGPNGTFDIQIDRIDNSSLVLDLDDQAIADAVDEVDQVFLNNTFTGGGGSTRLDNILAPADVVPHTTATVAAAEMTFANSPGGDFARLQFADELDSGTWTSRYYFTTAATQTLFDAAGDDVRAYRGNVE